MASRKGQKFYLGGKNNDSMVEKMMVERGWNRITNPKDPDFFMKWVELGRDIDFAAFRPGKQLVCRNPRIGLITNKNKLTDTLRRFSKTGGGVLQSFPPLNSFYPETYLLENESERKQFFEVAEKEASTIWICKPTGMNQGKGIFLITDIVKFKAELKDMLRPQAGRPPSSRLVARYIANPLLIDSRKFDVRVYMLIGCSSPFLVFYHHGYCRLSVEKYGADPSNLVSHLTNQYVQKKHPDYSTVKDDTVWSMAQFNTYLNTVSEEKGFPKDWVISEFPERVKILMKFCFASVRSLLDTRLGFFDLLGFDFMIDEHLNVWLIEVNVNPALFTNCKVLEEVIHPMVDETIDIVSECLMKGGSKASSTMLPLASLKTFELIVDESGSEKPTPSSSIGSNSSSSGPRMSSTFSSSSSPSSSFSTSKSSSKKPG